MAVVVLCREADRETVEPIARFCMADAVLTVEEIESRGVEATLVELGNAFRRPVPRLSVDALLARAEQRLGDDAGALADRVLSSLSRECEQSFLASVTDAETGLFTGPFMAFKLEEEFKRSWRFRTPLAVLLLDLPSMRDLGDARGQVLAEVAGVFLNECRDIDVLGRYDETSFLLLLPNTGVQGARVLATRVLDRMRQIGGPAPLEPAVAIVTVPRTGIERKDDLLDLARLTLVAAWAGEGHERIQLAP
jgi:diguanylate cyclase (GGDEF)-like protein